MAFAILNPPPLLGVPNQAAIQLADQTADSAEQVLAKAASAFSVIVYVKASNNTVAIDIDASDVGAGNKVPIGGVTFASGVLGAKCFFCVNPTGAQKAITVNVTLGGTCTYDIWIVPLG